MAIEFITQEITGLYCFAIRTDGGTQSRAELDYDHVEELEQALRNGATFPPLEVVYDGKEWWLVDGFHRLEATRRADLEQVNCVVFQGDQDYARWRSCAVNSAHGLKRSNADKRRAVVTALGHPKSKGLSDRAIAEHCGVSNNFVSDMRRVTPNCHSMTVDEPRLGLDGKTRKLPAPRNVYPIPGPDDFYDDHIGEVRFEMCQGGKVLLRALQVGDHCWHSCYNLDTAATQYEECISRHAEVFLDLEDAMGDAARRAAARLRMRREAASLPAGARRQIAGLLAWLIEQGAPPDVREDGAGLAAEPGQPVEVAEAERLEAADSKAGLGPDPEDEVAEPEGGWPEPNEAGVYCDHPSIVELVGEATGRAKAVISVVQIKPDWRGPRWLWAWGVNLKEGGASAPLTSLNRALTYEEAVAKAASALALWLHDRQAHASKVGLKQITELWQWAERQGADPLELEEMIRMRAWSEDRRLRGVANSLIDDLLSLRSCLMGESNLDRLAEVLLANADRDVDDEMHAEALESLEVLAGRLGELAAALDAAQNKKEKEDAA